MARRKQDKAPHTQPLARTADKYDLYQRSVQNPSHETPFFRRVYRDAFSSDPKILREDFCGTFAVCCEWVKGHKDRVAIGVDLDPEPLEWGMAHNLSRIRPSARPRITLMRENVLKVAGPKADIVAAQNFSFWIFKTRPEVVRYFKAMHRNLAKRGVVILDMMGGGDCIMEDHTDRRPISEEPIVEGNPRRFTYLWEQARYDPISHSASFYIHFQFRDKSEMKRAFEYHWRFWTIPEVREMLDEAGFAESHVYWEGTNKEGEGNDVYRRRISAPSDKVWIAYVVGVKK
ncbi:MAG: class I SAM-dependent methyltransferase [Phycisphaera sp.]|nr:class I SAM-dependent methyltransferase [Phycisphaera sp.]